MTYFYYPTASSTSLSYGDDLVVTIIKSTISSRPSAVPVYDRSDFYYELVPAQNSVAITPEMLNGASISGYSSFSAGIALNFKISYRYSAAFNINFYTNSAKTTLLASLTGITIQRTSYSESVYVVRGATRQRVSLSSTPSLNFGNVTPILSSPPGQQWSVSIDHANPTSVYQLTSYSLAEGKRWIINQTWQDGIWANGNAYVTGFNSSTNLYYHQLVITNSIEEPKYYFWSVVVPGDTTFTVLNTGHKESYFGTNSSIVSINAPFDLSWNTVVPKYESYVQLTHINGVATNSNVIFDTNGTISQMSPSEGDFTYQFGYFIRGNSEPQLRANTTVNVRTPINCTITPYNLAPSVTVYRLPARALVDVTLQCSPLSGSGNIEVGVRRQNITANVYLNGTSLSSPLHIPVAANTNMTFSVTGDFDRENSVTHIGAIDLYFKAWPRFSNSMGIWYLSIPVTTRDDSAVMYDPRVSVSGFDRSVKPRSRRPVTGIDWGSSDNFPVEGETDYSITITGGRPGGSYSVTAYQNLTPHGWSLVSRVDGNLNNNGSVTLPYQRTGTHYYVLNLDYLTKTDSYYFSVTTTFVRPPLLGSTPRVGILGSTQIVPRRMSPPPTWYDWSLTRFDIPAVPFYIYITDAKANARFSVVKYLPTGFVGDPITGSLDATGSMDIPITDVGPNFYRVLLEYGDGSENYDYYLSVMANAAAASPVSFPTNSITIDWSNVNVSINGETITYVQDTTINGISGIRPENLVTVPGKTEADAYNLWWDWSNAPANIAANSSLTVTITAPESIANVAVINADIVVHGPTLTPRSIPQQSLTAVHNQMVEFGHNTVFSWDTIAGHYYVRVKLTAFADSSSPISNSTKYWYSRISRPGAHDQYTPVVDLTWPLNRESIDGTLQQIDLRAAPRTTVPTISEWSSLRISGPGVDQPLTVRLLGGPPGGSAILQLQRSPNENGVPDNTNRRIVYDLDNSGNCNIVDVRGNGMWYYSLRVKDKDSRYYDKMWFWSTWSSDGVAPNLPTVTLNWDRTERYVVPSGLQADYASNSEYNNTKAIISRGLSITTSLDIVITSVADAVFNLKIYRGESSDISFESSGVYVTALVDSVSRTTGPNGTLTYTDNRVYDRGRRYFYYLTADGLPDHHWWWSAVVI